MNINLKLAQTIRRQRALAPIDPVHTELEPVRAYAEWISGVKGERHVAVTIPEGSHAFAMGYGYVSIPETELEHYLACGARLPA